MTGWAVGIDLGGTKAALGLIAPDGQISARARIPTLAEEGPQSVIERMGAVIDGFKSQIPSDAALQAVGVCAPGPLDHRTGTLINPTNLPKFWNTPLAGMLSTRLGGLPVRLEHDAKAAAIGERHYGAGRGTNSLAYIVVGTGVGAAILLEDQLLRGVRNFAGEVGHITLDYQDGEPCACGSRGCVETYMSGPWLERHYQRLTGEQLDGAQIASRAAAGESAAQQVMNRAGEALGVAVATMAMLIDVELYIIGGSVAKAGDVLLNPARAAAPHHCFVSVGPRLKIVKAELDEDGAILGAAWLALHG